MTAQRRHYAQERRRAREELLAGGAPGERLWGQCELCGRYHPQPAIRYRCACGWTRCAGRVDREGDVCPECGRRMTLQTNGGAGTGEE
jgi:hypothetical protein